MRYIWDRFPDYFGTGLKARVVYGPIAHFLQRWDVSSAGRVHHFVANSRHVAERIHKFYRREVDAVIYPPVDTDFFSPSDQAPDDYYLIVSALVPYKRLDLAIDCFNKRQETLYIVGTGPEEERLRARSGSNIRFLGPVDKEELWRLYQRARATLIPGVDDFGIVPVESQACGRPVVAQARGGATESVKAGETGVLFEEPSIEALSHAVDKVSSLRFNKMDLRNWALRFSRESFKSSIESYIEGKLSSAAMRAR
jgi:glycosyltransferase involved in cell wall biosynthesis